MDPSPNRYPDLDRNPTLTLTQVMSASLRVEATVRAPTQDVAIRVAQLYNAQTPATLSTQLGAEVVSVEPPVIMRRVVPTLAALEATSVTAPTPLVPIAAAVGAAVALVNPRQARTLPCLSRADVA